MADDIMTALRALANRWAMKARDFARAAKDESTTEAQASYNRGFAEGYYKAATELAQLLKEQETAAPPPRPAAPPPQPASPSPQQQGGRRSLPQTLPSPQAPAVPRPAAPAVTYAQVSVAEAIDILVFARCQPRDVIPNRDNSFHATFSSWGSLMLHEQVARVQNADPRIIILNSGKLESHDYFIDFAFKEN
jgi:hypothetical protein